MIGLEFLRLPAVADKQDDFGSGMAFHEVVVRFGEARPDAVFAFEPR